MTLLAPTWLLLLPVLAAAFAVVAWRRRGAARVHLRRLLWPAVLLALIVVALAGPQVRGEERSRHLSLIVDLSPSMLARTSVEELAHEAAAAIAQLSAHDRVSVIAAGRAPRVLIANAPRSDEHSNDEDGDDPATRWQRRLLDAFATAAGTKHQRPGTDLAAALEVALAQRPAEMPGGILLLSDGRHTASPAELEAARLLANQSGVAVEARLVGAAALSNVALLDGEAPRQVPTGRRYRLGATLRVEGSEPVAVTLWIGGRGGRTLSAATLTLTHHGRPLPPVAGTAKTWRLAPGTYRVEVDAPAQHEPGFVPHEIRIRHVEPPEANAVNADDAVAVGTVVADESVTLLTEDGEPGYFGEWLRRVRPELEVRALSPRDAALPQTPADFLGTGAWVLCGVSRDDFASFDEFAAFDASLAAAVERHGLRMMMLGGPRAFGPGGYIDSRLEDVLPVDLDPNRDVAAAVAFVLDTSGSMAEGDRMARAAQAGVRLLERLSERDVIALIRFERSPRLVMLPEAGADGFSPSSDATQRHMVAELDRLTRGRHDLLGGTTDLYKALREAVERLAGRDEDAKLVLMLTDGEPTDGHTWFNEYFERLVATARENEIILAVLATEPVDVPPVNGRHSVLGGLREATLVDPELGTVERVEDLAELPQVFIDQLAEARGPLLAEPLAEGEPGYAVLDAAQRKLGPHVKRYARTKLKQQRHIVAPLWFPDEEPLLAEWSVGAGFAAALMLPLERVEMLGEEWEAVLTEAEHPVREALLETVDRLVAPTPRVPFATALERDDAGEAQVVVHVDAALTESATRRAWAESAGFALRLEEEPEAHDRAEHRGWRIPASTPSRFVAPLPEPLREGVSFTSVRTPDGRYAEHVVLAAPLHPEWRDLTADAATLERLTTAPQGIHAWLAGRAPTEGEPAPLAPWLALLAVLALIADAAARLLRRRHV